MHFAMHAALVLYGVLWPADIGGQHGKDGSDKGTVHEHIEC